MLCPTCGSEKTEPSRIVAGMRCNDCGAVFRRSDAGLDEDDDDELELAGFDEDGNVIGSEGILAGLGLSPLTPDELGRGLVAGTGAAHFLAMASKPPFQPKGRTYMLPFQRDDLLAPGASDVLEAYVGADCLPRWFYLDSGRVGELELASFAVLKPGALHDDELLHSAGPFRLFTQEGLHPRTLQSFVPGFHDGTRLRLTLKNTGTRPIRVRFALVAEV